MLSLFVIAVILLMICLTVRSKKEWPTVVLAFLCGAAMMFAAYLNTLNHLQ